MSEDIQEIGLIEFVPDKPRDQIYVPVASWTAGERDRDVAGTRKVRGSEHGAAGSTEHVPNGYMAKPLEARLPNLIFDPDNEFRPGRASRTQEAL